MNHFSVLIRLLRDRSKFLDDMRTRTQLEHVDTVWREQN